MALSDQDILDFVGENPGAGRDAIRKGAAQDDLVGNPFQRLRGSVGSTHVYAVRAASRSYSA